MWKSQRAICLKSTNMTWSHMTSITRPHEFGWSAITRFTFYPFPPLFSTIAKLKHQNHTPLTLSQIFQDISADHTQETVTIKPFIHSASLQAASMHPCKHTSIMKKVIERMNHSIVQELLAQCGKPSFSMGKDTPKKEKKWLFSQKLSGSGKDVQLQAGAEEEEVEGMRVDFYLVVFLKFIVSIMLTIEVESTMPFSVGSLPSSSPLPVLPYC